MDRSAFADDLFAESDEKCGVTLVRCFDREPSRKVYRAIHCLSFGTIDLRPRWRIPLRWCECLDFATLPIGRVPFVSLGADEKPS